MFGAGRCDHDRNSRCASPSVRHRSGNLWGSNLRLKILRRGCQATTHMLLPERCRAGSQETEFPTHKPKAKRLREVLCMGSKGFYSSEGPGTKDINKGGPKGFIGIHSTNQVWAKGRRESKLTNLGEGGRQRGERDQWDIEERRTF